MPTSLLRRNFSGATSSARRLARGGLTATVALAAAVALSSPAAATTVTDPADDFLTTFSGPHNGNLDVTAASVTFSNSIFHFSATLAGNVDSSTPGTAYVWGIDRGAGTAVLNQGPAPVGAGVTFDMVAVIFPDGSAILSQINDNGLFGAVTPLTPAISGNTMTVDIAASLLPATAPGTDIEEFRFNFWPRVGVDVKNGAQVSDFAPGGIDGVGSTFTVPEPGSLALMIGGVGLAGLIRRRASASAAQA